MKSRVNKKLIIILLFSILFVGLFPKISNAVLIQYHETADKKGLYDLGAGAVDNQLRIWRNGNSFTEAEVPNVFIQDRTSSHVYCIQHHSATEKDYYDYDIKSYIEINGTVAKNSSNKTVTKSQNLVLAYLLEQEDYRKGYSGSDSEAVRNLAINHYLTKGGWRAAVGDTLGVEDDYISYLDLNDYHGSYTGAVDPAKKFIERAKKFELKDPTITADKSSLVVDSMETIGPITFTFNGVIDAIKLYNGNTEVTGATFKVGDKIKEVTEIKSGEKVTIVNNKASKVTKIEAFNKTQTNINAQMWFCANSNAKQNLLVIKSSRDYKWKKTTVDILQKGSLTVTKKDSVSSKTITDATKFKVYKKDSGWLSGINTYVSKESDANEYSTSNGVLKLDGLLFGTYTVKEVAAPSGYTLAVQPTKSVDLTIDASHLNPSKDFSNVKTGSLTIYKRDLDANPVVGLEAGFKIKTSAGKDTWLSGTKYPYTYNSSYANATTYYTKDLSTYSGSNITYVTSTSYGKGITISGLNEGTYKVYEVSAPSGYLLKHQVGYDSTNNRANLNNNERTISFTKTGNTTAQYCAMALTNVKKVSIEGYVWSDEPPTKDGAYNSKYDDTRESTLKGVTVRLMKKGNPPTQVATTTTNNNGKYLFDSLIKLSELENYYVEFNYKGSKEFYNKNGTKVKTEDTSKYIPVAFSATTENGSKAMMKNVATKDIDLSGIATTYTGDNTAANKTAIGNYGLNKCGTWNGSTLTISNINLGIKELKKADYNLTQNLAYAKIDINGYTFTYNYGGRGDTSMIAAPKTNWQKKGTISGYTADIYPSDIAYSVSQTDDNKRIKVYVVYRIDITNTTNYNIPELYKESKLRISSLNNYYDGNRYTLEKSYNLDNNNNVTKDFDDWSEASDTTRNGKNLKVATYNLDKYKDGIGQNKTITSFIEFRVKDDAIKKILENPNGIIEEYPTEAETKGYHEYTRKDYSWDLKISKDNQSHITPDDIRSSVAPYLIFREHKEKERTIKGIVFEDKAPDTENAVNVEKLGDGVYNSNENVVKGVKVDLIEVPSGVTDLRQLSAEEIKNLQPATRYQKDESGTPKPTNSTIITDDRGNYNLVGVVPGRYFLRFTYGDGTQKICNTSGNEIKTIVGKDYKSTIVKEANAKTALNGGTKEEWYKDMDSKVISSVALDNLNTRKIANEAAEGKADVMASTAKMSVTIENNDTTDFNMPKNTNYDSDDPEKITLTDSKDTKEEIYAKYLNTIKAEDTFNGLSFGIIEAPKQDSEIQKLITNVKLTNTQGNVLYNGNPESVASQGVVALSDLDGIKNGGSTYVRTEMQEESIYGTNLELTYEVEITNKSDINYYNNEYYWYGEKNNNKEVTLTPTDVKDYLDETLTYIEGKSDKNRITSNGTKNITVENNKSVKAQEMDLKGWKTIYTNKITDRPTNYPTSDKVKIVANRLLSNNDDDMEVVSRAEIKDIKHTPDPKDSTPQAEKEEQVKIAPKEVHTNGMTKATFTITPPTGENRNATSIYAIAGIMSLIILSTGIVIIKKKVI